MRWWYPVIQSTGTVRNSGEVEPYIRPVVTIYLLVSNYLVKCARRDCMRLIPADRISGCLYSVLCITKCVTVSGARLQGEELSWRAAQNNNKQTASTG